MLKTFLGLVVTGLVLHDGWAQRRPEPPVPLNSPAEQSNAVVRFDCTWVDLQTDGKSDVLRHYRVALLTDRAIRDNAQDVTVYNLGYDTVIVLTACVHLPSGETVNVEPSAIKDVPMPAFGKFFLQNVREKIITFPDLTKGAEIEVAYREITREVPMDGHYDLWEEFQQDEPIQQKHVEISVPNEMNLRWLAKGAEIPHDSSIEGDRVKHVWHVEDVPQLVPERGMPPYPELVSRLLVSTVPDWQTWSRWYYRLCEPELVADDSIRAAVQRLAAGKTTDQKLHWIFYFVSNQVRYVETALTGRKAGYKPEPAAVTYANRYGVCRDKAALLVTMLREAEIPANIALMNPVWKIDADLPVDQFNHAIVAAEVDGHTVLLDPTVEKTREFLAATEQDKAILISTDQGDDLSWTPIQPPEENLYRVRAESELAEDGSFSSTVTITAHGYADRVLRNTLQGLPPERREQMFKRLVARIHPAAILDSMTTSNMMDFGRPAEIHLTFHAADYPVTAGKYLLFSVPGQAEGLDFITRQLLSGSELTRRRFDLRLASTFSVRVEETVTFPSGYRIRSLPDRLDVSYGDFRMSREFSVAGNTVSLKREVDFSTLKIPLARYGDLQDLLRRSDSMARGRVILVKG
jgi:hypothetical protein